jgi:hypothetical protein
MVLLISLTAIYLVTTGVQFWITDYFNIVIGVSRQTASISFAVIAITGPVFGVMIGGYIFTKLGGYNTP